MRLIKIFKDKRGLSLIEGLVAILILTMGIIPSFSMVLIASNLSSTIANNLTASNLGQEGIEVVRALRDSNWLAGSSFDAGLADGSYRVEWNSSSLMPESGNPVLKLDSSGLYNYSSGVDSIFRRRITITKIDPGGCGCELQVVSEISWPEKKVTKIVRIESHLFDWK